MCKQILAFLLVVLLVFSSIPTIGEQESFSLMLGGEPYKINLPEGEWDWISGNPLVAEVSEDGMITPTACGTAVVKAVDGENEMSWSVVVGKPSISLSESDVSLLLGNGKNVTINGLSGFDNGYDVNFDSADDSVANVDETGYITAIGSGSTTITATVAGIYEASCAVTVIKPITSIEASIDKPVLKVGETALFTYKFSPEDADDVAITLSSTNTKVALVDESGLVNAVGPGTCVLTATDKNGAFSQVEVNVIREAESIQFVQKKDLLDVGEEFDFGASIYPEDTTDKRITYSSSDPDVVLIDQNGRATAVAKGEAVIYAAATNGLTTQTSVSVYQSAKSIVINNALDRLDAGESVQLSATVYPDDATDRSVTWSTASAQIAVVDESGMVTGVGPGIVTITAKSVNGLTASVTFEVIRHAEKVVPARDSFIIGLGQSVLLPATVYPLDVTDGSVKWESENPAIAYINESNGRVVGAAQGITYLVATGENVVSCRVPLKVLAKNKGVTKVKLSKSSVSIYEKYKTTLRATVSPSTATYKAVKWVSSDPSIATVTSKGVVRGIKKGTCYITAISTSGISATCKVNVKEVMASKVKLNKRSMNLALEKTYRLTAKVTPTNTKNKTITWISSNPGIASVDAYGRVTAIGLGTCKIKAQTVNGKYALCTVKVVPNKVSSIKLNAKKFTGYIGQTYQMTTAIKPLNATNKAVLWKTSNKKVATVSSTGLITPLKVGTAKITCTARDGSRKSAYVTVTVKERRVTSFTIDNMDIQLNYGETYAVTSHVLPENASYRKITWASNNTQVATVSSNGVVTARNRGKAVIKGTVDGNRKAVAFTVNVMSDSTSECRALVIGEFSKKGASGFLPFSTNGTTAVKDALYRSSIYGVGYKIALNGSNPTKSTIKTLIRNTFAGADEDDISLVYILTHGTVSNGMYYMLTDTKQANALSASELIDCLKAIPGNVVLVCCTCHSGSFINQYAPNIADSTIALQMEAKEANTECTNGDGEPKFSVICSSAADTTSSFHKVTDIKKSYDFFTNAFVTGLGWDMIGDKAIGGSLPADMDLDGQITLYEIATYSKQRVKDTIQSYLSVAANKKTFAGNAGQTVTYYLPNPNLVIFGGDRPIQ